MINLNINGITYLYPEAGDVDWGPSTTQWAQAVTSGMLQKAGGAFPLTQNVDFGGTNGLISIFFSSRSANTATQGQFRLSSQDQIMFRNQSNTLDLPIGLNVNDQLTFNGVPFVPVSVQDTTTIELTQDLSGLIEAQVKSDSLTDTEIATNAAIAYSKLNLVGSLVNADVATNAAIQMSKLEVLTSNRAAVTDGSGAISASTITNTELGYLSGATSNIQTQLTGKANLSGATFVGAVVLPGNPVSGLQAATKAYVDSVAQGLAVKPQADVASTGNLTLSGEQTIDGVLTSNTRILVKNQNNQAENGVYVTSSGSWSRSSDMNQWEDLVSAYVFVSGGSTQAFSGWYFTVSPGGTLGTTPVTIELFSQAGTITTDGQGLELVGTELSLELDGTTLSKSSLGLKVNEINNAQIGAAAAISLSKLQTLTANRVLLSNGSGVVSASSVTNTTLSYLDVTSSIQTQLNGKLTNPMTTNGDLITRASGNPARLGIGSTNQVLTVVAGQPAWASINQPQSITSVSSNLTLSSQNMVYLVNTTATRTLQLPSPTAGMSFTVKDVSGQAATNPINIQRYSTEQIEGVSATKLLQTNYGAWRFLCDGTNWWIL